MCVCVRSVRWNIVKKEKVVDYMRNRTQNQIHRGRVMSNWFFDVEYKDGISNTLIYVLHTTDRRHPSRDLPNESLVEIQMDI